MNLELFKEILQTPSTSGEERALAENLKSRLVDESCSVKEYEVGDGTLNLLFDWSGTACPSFVFCTHLDTVPPYIPPTFADIKKGDLLPDGKVALCDDVIVKGRGSCDAKGQLFSMYSACLQLAGEGYKDFGLLLLAGEETGSFGAKAYSKDCPGGGFVLVGEPTDNCMATASKGTKSFEISVSGKACHSGYPDHGKSAINTFVDFVNKLESTEFPEDPLLGKTTWNFGKLVSDNPQNILSPSLTCRLYFRTTFATDSTIQSKLESLCGEDVNIKAFGGDTPLHYFTDTKGINSKPVSFGSDAPRLEKFPRKAICGPGSILTAHTDNEYVLVSDLELAVKQDIMIFKSTI